MEKRFVIGVDFGTDSVRSVLVDEVGNRRAGAVHRYDRWGEGKYSDPRRNRFRHHPADYLEGLESTLTRVLEELSAGERGNVRAVSVDTTGSTPAPVDRSGRPLALDDRFAENPNAMFILWKDHTAIREAGEINRLARNWEVDYTKYVGGVYSSEWFWAKILHTLREDEAVREAAWSWAELCDWIPFELTGGEDAAEMKRSRCAAGHKAMWNEEFGGLPSEEFLSALDPLLSGLRDRLYEETYTSDHPAGTLSDKWADKLNLPDDVRVGVGAFDAHMGAVGGGIEPYHLCRVMGTSTCDMLVAPEEEVGDKLVHGICGQVDGSVIPGMIGLEAGQSAFGDVYSWFRDLLLWSFDEVVAGSDYLDREQKEKLKDEVAEKIIPGLTAVAEDIDEVDTGIVALDWLNGRRTPDANQRLTSTIEGLDLGSDAPLLFKALVEATCFGAKMIVDRFEEEGIPIEGVIGMGGVAKKSPYVMQTLADVLNMPIRIVRSDQTCALGAAMFAAAVAGIYDSVEEAKDAMNSGFEATYSPDSGKVEKYRHLFERYRSLAEITETRIMNETDSKTAAHE